METNNLRKFKLIKEYPGSPKLATELTPKVDKENTDTNNFYWEGSWFNPNDFSEFWEEVIEKDYEIVAMGIAEGTILEFKDGICTKRSDDRAPEATSTLQSILNQQYSKDSIHSVKRLSDEEVFTVGDLIKTPYKDATRITKFQNPEGNEYFIKIPTGFARLVTIEKAKQPLFLTHDGKDIFEGDKVWYVNKEGHYYSGFVAVSGVTLRSDINAYFLTREGAEDYIEKNKVIFTTEDRVEIRIGDKYYFVDMNSSSISLVNAHVRSGGYSERKYFSTFETAQYYIILNAKVLSIEEFWEFDSKPGSNLVKQKALKRLVKQRLKIE
jgi:hypothetical protein